MKGTVTYGISKALRAAALCALVLASAADGRAQSDRSPRVWEAPLSIPTYELGAPDPNPALLDWNRRKWRPVYPYAMMDTLTTKRVEKSYKAVYLENEYLKVTVLPELGGHVYAIFDKTANRDVLYTNHVVKYAMVAIRGAWVSGGIEWNFPDGHTLTTVSPIDYATRMEADGSAAVVIGDTERVQRMSWSIICRLRPGSKALETEVTLNNRRETPGRYWYWSTAAAPATEDMRFVYPMRESYPHAFWPVYSFPKEKGVDIGTYREVKNELSLFARNSKRDFFGVYYEKSDWGIVHVADHKELPGKKTWTWGTDESGRIWVDKLTDADGQYVEFQAGRFETQMEHEFIAPHRVERFTEYWFPVNRMGGGFDEATRDAAVNVNVEGQRATVIMNANAKFDDAGLTVEAGGRRLHTDSVDLDPAKAHTASFNIPADAAGQPLVVTLRAKDGRQLLRYSTDAPADGNADFKPATRPRPDPKAPASAEQAYVEGLAADKKSNERVARAAFQEALKRDAGFAPAHTALGLSYYRSGEYERATGHLEAALRRNKDAGDAHYYLGLVRRAEGRSVEASEHLMWAVRAGHRESVARYVLGEMALAAGDTASALEHLQQAVLLDPRDLKARTVLALAERAAGRLESAQQRIDAVVWEAPLDYLALAEQSEIHRARGNDAKADGARGQLWRLLSREPDSVLELAFDYLAAGRLGEGRGVLEEGIRRAGAQGARAFPMLHYALGYFHEKAGDTARAREQYALGSQGDTAFVFPHRVEELAVLRAAAAANPSDGRAAYYLGNVLASKGRGEEALTAWRDAVRLDPSNGVARRNLARALWLVAGKKDEAASEYERAIKAAAEDFHLYVELDRLLAEMNATPRRIRLLEGAPESVRRRSPVVQATAAAYVEAGRFGDAAALLERTQFTSGEGEFAALGIFRRAHIGLAREHQRAGRHAEAAREFLRATEYPKNLGAGAPSMQSQAREYVAAAGEFEAAGVRDEAERLWRRAADEPLNSPTQPTEPWSEHYYFKAVALERVGRREEARALYQRLANLNDEARMLEAEPAPPEGAIRYVLAGAGLKALGRTAEARAALERALKMDPQNELAKTQLAELSAPARGRAKTGSGR
ncbi:MAG TPA: tetratricopeptide repeat protein [Pyrinomonadaceae bacterium]